MRQIYLDNAATSYPKPPSVVKAINEYFSEIGVSPGRGGYRLGLDAGRKLLIARETIGNFFNCDDPSMVVFTMNITYAINLVIRGVLKEGDHVITSSLEHNSVARPLEALKQSGIIDYTIVQANEEGFVNPDHIRKSIRKNTKLIVLNHASNVFGGLQPAEEIGQIATQHGLLYLLDTAQTAGSILIDMKKLGVNFLAFTGHKGLFGPPGIGGLCIDMKETNKLEPIILGGTGSKSHLLEQPVAFPDRLESGTPNTPGIMGLTAGIEFINKIGLDKIKKHESDLLSKFLDGCSQLPEIKIYGAKDLSMQTPCVSLNINEIDGGQLSFILDQVYGIMTRSGLHCSPWAHQTMGTFPEGTVRFSFGWFNTLEEIEYTINALKEIIND
ncbi:MAG: cysteine desulfurase [Desulfitibacter sp. BRH_c19]|nr:MAG: cysteine desulfurase [Desulfitibacter sp. BRH_c19]